MLLSTTPSSPTILIAKEDLTMVVIDTPIPVASKGERLKLLHDHGDIYEVETVDGTNTSFYTHRDKVRPDV